VAKGSKQRVPRSGLNPGLRKRGEEIRERVAELVARRQVARTDETGQLHRAAEGQPVPALPLLEDRGYARAPVRLPRLSTKRTRRERQGQQAPDPRGSTKRR